MTRFSLLALSSLAILAFFAFRTETVPLRPATVPAVVPAGIGYAIVPAASSLHWQGSKTIDVHEGTVALKSGKLVVNNGVIAGGSVVMDMTSIVCTDLEYESDNEHLVEFLKGVNFFDAATYPTATFTLTEVSPLPAGGSATHTVKGTLTLRGKTNAIAFPANIAVSPTEIVATAANVVIDRTLWGITYKSATLANVVKDKAISDDMTLQIRLKAVK